MKNLFNSTVFLAIFCLLLSNCTPPPGGPVSPHANYVKFKMDGVQHYSNWDDSVYDHHMHFSDPTNYSDFYFYDNIANHFGILIVIDGNHCYAIDTNDAFPGSPSIPGISVQYIKDQMTDPVHLYAAMPTYTPADDCSIDSTAFIEVIDASSTRMYTRFAFDLVNATGTDTIRIREGEYYLDE